MARLSTASSSAKSPKGTGPSATSARSRLWLGRALNAEGGLAGGVTGLSSRGRRKGCVGRLRGGSGSLLLNAKAISDSGYRLSDVAAWQPGDISMGLCGSASSRQVNECANEHGSAKVEPDALGAPDIAPGVVDFTSFFLDVPDRDCVMLFAQPRIRRGSDIGSFSESGKREPPRRLEPSGGHGQPDGTG